MSFDRIASYYHWLEKLTFSDQLQQARIAFVRQIGSPRCALVVGEGDGRFLAQLLREHQTLRVDCVEASARMIGLARTRVEEERVRFVCADVREVPLEENFYDLIVTHFFFDCFRESELREVIGKLASAATNGAIWLVSDFCEPLHGWRRFKGRALIALMYAFFRATAGIEAHRLVDYTPFLRAEGFALTNEALSADEMIRSQVWRRYRAGL